MPVPCPVPFDAVIGIDCATQPERVGLAWGRRTRDGWSVDRVTLGAGDRTPAALVSAWVAEQPRTLLALDAPLGWPAALGDALVHHRAGAALDADVSELFTRVTDRVIRTRYGKRPLEVGADRIARTARAALELLHEVRRTTGHAVPLAWDASADDAPHAVEVYPAATLAAHGLPSRQYKVPGSEARGPIAAALRARLAVPDPLDLVALPGDALDALVCVLAGIDVAEGTALAPRDEERGAAEREGWIWVRG